MPAASEKPPMIQKTRWKSPSASPARIMPPPLPKPIVALSTPTPVANCARGSASRTTPMDKGTSAATEPCNTRATISQGNEVAMAAMTEPATRNARAPRIMRRLPYMSPKRESSGVDTAPTSRLTVSVQLTAVKEVFSSRCSTGSNGTTAVFCMAAMEAATDSATTAGQGFLFNVSRAAGTTTVAMTAPLDNLGK